MTAISSSAIETPQGARGFTLMELLVVLAIIALIAVIAMRGYLQPNPMSARRDRAAVQQRIEAVRSKAILTGRSVDLVAEELPQGITIQSPAGARLRWFADGSALPGTVSRAGRAITSIDPITGMAQDAP